MSKKELIETFKVYGPLTRATIRWSSPEGLPHCTEVEGTVGFLFREDAEKAMENLNGKSIDSYPIKLSWAQSARMNPNPLFMDEISDKELVKNVKDSWKRHTQLVASFCSLWNKEERKLKQRREQVDAFVQMYFLIKQAKLATAELLYSEELNEAQKLKVENLFRDMVKLKLRSEVF